MNTGFPRRSSTGYCFTFCGVFSLSIFGNVLGSFFLNFVGSKPSSITYGLGQYPPVAHGPPPATMAAPSTSMPYHAKIFMQALAPLEKPDTVKLLDFRSNFFS